MTVRRCGLYLAVLGALGTAPGAHADTTLGTTTQPTGTTTTKCSDGAVIAQATDTTTSPYFVPTGGGFVKGWQVNTTGATPAGRSRS